MREKLTQSKKYPSLAFLYLVDVQLPSSQKLTYRETHRFHQQSDLDSEPGNSCPQRELKGGTAGK